jgi:hypothetical protein
LNNGLIKNYEQGLAGVAQEVASKHEALSSNPSTTKKKKKKQPNKKKPKPQNNTF